MHLSSKGCAKKVRKVAILQVFKHFLLKDCVAHKVASAKVALGLGIMFLLLDGNRNDTDCAGNARQHGFEECS